MTYQELIKKYEDEINTLNTELLKKIAVSNDFQNLGSTELAQHEETIQFYLFSLSMEIKNILKNKIEEIEKLHSQELDKEVNPDILDM